MTFKNKILLFFPILCLTIMMLIVGVFAVSSSHNINLYGQVDFVISSDSLYVKDVRIKYDSEEEQQLPNFIPGFINDLNINLSGLTSQSGNFTLYFDIINTTDSTYSVDEVSLSSDLVLDGVSVSFSGNIAAGTVSSGAEITDTTPISGQLVINVSATQAAEIDLSGITIVIAEETPTPTPDPDPDPDPGPDPDPDPGPDPDPDPGPDPDPDPGPDPDPDPGPDPGATPLEYEFEDNEYGGLTITKYLGDDYEIDIPAYVYEENGEYYLGDESNYQFEVNVIGESAFYDINHPLSNISSITLPSTIRSIGDLAFRGHNFLTSVYIDFENMEELGEAIFLDCPNLEIIEGNNGPRYEIDSNCIIDADIGGLYWGAKDFTDNYEFAVIMPYSLHITDASGPEIHIAGDVMPFAFAECTRTEPVTINFDGELVEGSLAYFWLDNLVVYGPNIDGENGYVFNTETRVLIKGFYETMDDLPTDIERVGDYAFAGNDRVETIIIDSNLISIGDYAFAYCSNLLDISFPGTNELKRIGNYAFAWSNPNLRFNNGDGFEITDKFEFIGYSAFIAYGDTAFMNNIFSENSNGNCTLEIYDIYFEAPGESFNDVPTPNDLFVYYQSYWVNVSNSDVTSSDMYEYLKDSLLDETIQFVEQGY